MSTQGDGSNNDNQDEKTPNYQNTENTKEENAHPSGTMPPHNDTPKNETGTSSESKSDPKLPSEGEGNQSRDKSRSKHSKSKKRETSRDSSVESDTAESPNRESRNERQQRLTIRTPWSYESYSESESFDTFWERTSSLFALANVPPERQYKILLQLMMASSMWLVRDIDQAEIDTIDKLVKHLRARLCPQSRVFNHRVSLSRCRMRENETVAQFASHIKSVAFAAHPQDRRLRNSSALDSFLGGLSPSLRSSLAPNLVLMPTDDDNKAFAHILSLAEAVEGLQTNLAQNRDQQETRSADRGRSGQRRVVNAAIELPADQVDHPTARAREPTEGTDQRRDDGATRGYRGNFQRGNRGGYQPRPYQGNRYNSNYQQGPARYREQSRQPFIPISTGRGQPLLGFTANEYTAKLAQTRPPMRCFRCDSLDHRVRDCPCAPAQLPVAGHTANRAVATFGRSRSCASAAIPQFFF